MEQLSLLESPRPNSNAAVWKTLDDKRKTQIVMILARLIIQLATGARAELEHNPLVIRAVSAGFRKKYGERWPDETKDMLKRSILPTTLRLTPV